MATDSACPVLSAAALWHSPEPFTAAGTEVRGTVVASCLPPYSPVITGEDQRKYGAQEMDKTVREEGQVRRAVDNVKREDKSSGRWIILRLVYSKSRG